MEILLYNELKTQKIPGYQKLIKLLRQDDFKSAEVKKVADNLYRAKLDKSNRLLFAIYQYDNQRYALILEWIQHHAYEKSRFLSQKTNIQAQHIPDIDSLQTTDLAPLNYVNPAQKTFNLLDKVISFDAFQHTVYQMPSPLIVIGSAGSGKTALILEKLKQCEGDILYLSRSPYLVHNARSVYYAAGYHNENQQIEFFSFQEYLESILVPGTQEISFNTFHQWFSRQKKTGTVNDGHKLFEEFSGVITGSQIDAAFLSEAQYLALGVKQSIYNPDERAEVYGLFVRYQQFLQHERYYDPNMLSYEYLARVHPKYDFIMIDEVQDLTNVQLQLILKSLHNLNDFILCGDANQIVHPNFFSWSGLKSLFYEQRQTTGQSATDIIQILNHNYRNSPEVTAVANKILKIKNARFGSIDKESHYLVTSQASQRGEIQLLKNDAQLKQRLNHITRRSTQFAVIVMRPEQKAEAHKDFDTPLVFSIQEVKGLEYENIIIYDFISSCDKAFREITSGVTHEDLQKDFRYARSKNKQDKSLEVYKFYINALYVAVTRAVKNLYLIESNPKQPMLNLLDVTHLAENLNVAEQTSSLSEWRDEADKLEMQGKQAQADEIRQNILQQKQVPWVVLNEDQIEPLYQRAIVAGQKKEKITLFEYALVHQNQALLNALADANFKSAKQQKKNYALLDQKYYIGYSSNNHTLVLKQVDQYGVNFRNVFNQTPIMIASRFGNGALVKTLNALHADTELVNNSGFNALQIGLEQACLDSKFAKNKLANIYHQLCPESLSLQVDGQLVKIDSHLMEFF